MRAMFAQRPDVLFVAAVFGAFLPLIFVLITA